MLKRPYIVHAQLVAVHPESVGTLFLEKDHSDIYDNLALALGHRAQPLAAALISISDDIVVNLGSAEPEHLLPQGESGEGGEGKAVPRAPSCGPLPPSRRSHPKAGWPAA